MVLMSEIQDKHHTYDLLSQIICSGRALAVDGRAWPGPTRLTFRNTRFEPEGGLAALLRPLIPGPM